MGRFLGGTVPKTLAGAHVPQESLSEAEALAGGAAELEGSVHHVRLQAQLVRHLLHEIRVPAAKGADRQNSELQLAIKAPANHPNMFTPT